MLVSVSKPILLKYQYSFNWILILVVTSEKVRVLEAGLVAHRYMYRELDPIIMAIATNCLKSEKLMSYTIIIHNSQCIWNCDYNIDQQRMIQ